MPKRFIDFDRELGGKFKDLGKIGKAGQYSKGWKPAWGDFGNLFRSIERKEKRKKRRTPIPIGTVKKLLLRSKGKCEKCGTKLGSRLIPDFHHKNEKPSDHKMTNILVLCPNCHRKETNRLKEKTGSARSKKTAKKRKTISILDL